MTRDHAGQHPRPQGNNQDQLKLSGIALYGPKGLVIFDHPYNADY
jgi:hypothetical protein